MKHSSKDNKSFLSHQDQVNAEIFQAIKLLGRRLEKTEDVRDGVQNRLNDLESGAEVDSQTGKFFLPLVIDAAQLPETINNGVNSSSKTVVLSSFISFFVAIAALTIVLMQQPTASSTNNTQLAELNIPWAKGEWQTVGEVNQQIEQERTLATMMKRLQKNEQMMADLQQRQIYVENKYSEALLKDIEIATVAETTPTVEIEDIVVAEAEKVVEEKKIVKKVPKKETKEITKEPVVFAEKAVKEVVKVKEAKVAKVAKEIKEVKAKEVIKPVEKTIVAKSSANYMEQDSNLPEELRALENKAFDGEAAAQHDLGALYASGQVVDSNHKRAAYWFLKAAEGGIANAHYNLGVMYHQGMGLQKDAAKALYWYREAAALAHPEALYNLGVAYIEGIGTAIDTNRGIGYLKRAAGVGVAQAAYNLGVLYEGHFSEEKDSISKAIQWYEYAGEMGYTDAIKSAQRLNKTGKTQFASSDAYKDDELKIPHNLNEIETAAGYELFPPVVAVMEEGSADDSMFDTATGTAYPVQMVSRIQRVLIDMDLMPGVPTGIVDPKTTDAIRVFQKSANLIVDGKPSQYLLDFLLFNGEQN